MGSKSDVDVRNVHTHNACTTTYSQQYTLRALYTVHTHMRDIITVGSPTAPVHHHSRKRIHLHIHMHASALHTFRHAVSSCWRRMLGYRHASITCIFVCRLLPSFHCSAFSIVCLSFGRVVDPLIEMPSTTFRNLSQLKRCVSVRVLRYGARDKR